MSRRGFTAQTLVPSDLAEYDRLAHEYGSVFNTIAWTELFGDNLTRYGLYDACGTLRGGFCLFRERRAGLTIIRNPPSTPEIGPFFEPQASHPVAQLEERRDVLTAVADLLVARRPPVVSLSLSPQFTDYLPFYWRSFKVISGYTYLLDLTHTETELLQGMKSEHRNRLRSAGRDGLKVRQEPDYGVVHELVRDTFRRQNRDLKLGYLNRILDSSALRPISYAFATYRLETPIACVYVIHDAKNAVYLLGGYRSDNHHTGAGVMAMFAAITHARTLGLQVFDFEGSVIPSIERYFRFFGGRLSHRFRVNKAWLPLEIALKLVKRQLF